MIVRSHGSGLAAFSWMSNYVISIFDPGKDLEGFSFVSISLHRV